MPRTISTVRTYTRAQLSRYRSFHDVTGGERGVVFDYEHYRDGAMFTLIREPHHTDEDIENAKAFLRCTRDVVGFKDGRVAA